MPTPAPLLNPWLAGPLGSAVLRAEAELLQEALDDVFGWELVQMGLWGAARGLLGGCRTQRRDCRRPAATPVVVTRGQ